MVPLSIKEEPGLAFNSLWPKSKVFFSDIFEKHEPINDKLAKISDFSNKITKTEFNFFVSVFPERVKETKDYNEV